jgi:hypothetical protein
MSNLSLLTSLGIFSSKVAGSNANEALIAGKGCNANLSATGLDPARLSDLQYYATIQNMKTAEHLAYALRCYGQQQGNVAQLDACKLLTKPALPYKVNNNASCPFSADICKQSTGNFHLETNFLDSYTDLGMNKGPRFTVRLQHHCAPLVTDGHSRLHNDSGRPGINIMRYDYGATNSPYPAFVDVPLNTTSPETEQMNSDYNV